MENSFSSVAGSKEEEITTKLLAHIANEAGFQTNFSFVDEVEFSEEGFLKRVKIMSIGLSLFLGKI